MSRFSKATPDARQLPLPPSASDWAFTQSISPGYRKVSHMEFDACRCPCGITLRDSSHFDKNLRLNHKMRQWMKRIVIIGAGFAGLAAAKAFRHANADVLVIDRANHNLFQPLLYLLMRWSKFG
jgi:pyridine nucleotide-disulfide oxidoreductase